MSDLYYPTEKRPTGEEVQAAIAEARSFGAIVIGWTKRRAEGEWSIHLITRGEGER